MTFFLHRLPGLHGGAMTRRAGLPIVSGHRLFDEPHPTLMRTPAAALRGARRLCQASRLAGPDTHSFPTPWPFEVRRACLQEASRWAGLTGGAVARQSLLGRCDGGRVDFGTMLRLRSRYLGQLRLNPFKLPRPTLAALQCFNGHGRRPIKAPGCQSCQGHPHRTRVPQARDVFV